MADTSKLATENPTAEETPGDGQDEEEAVEHNEDGDEAGGGEDGEDGGEDGEDGGDGGGDKVEVEAEEQEEGDEGDEGDEAEDGKDALELGDGEQGEDEPEGDDEEDMQDDKEYDAGTERESENPDEEGYRTTSYVPNFRKGKNDRGQMYQVLEDAVEEGENDGYEDEDAEEADDDASPKELSTEDTPLRRAPDAAGATEKPADLSATPLVMHAGRHEETARESGAKREKFVPTITRPVANRSLSFELAKFLLQTVWGMSLSGELDPEQKGFLKDLIVRRESNIFAIAQEAYRSLSDPTVDHAEAGENFKRALLALH